MISPGFIDIHSHVLPGIDDGCKSIEQSIKCIRSLVDHGFVGTICTPHSCLDAYPLNSVSLIHERVTQLQDALAEQKIDYQLWTGAEIRLASSTINDLRDDGIPALAQGNFVLVDYWGEEWLPFADDGIAYLMDEGYQVILAHPERMKMWDDVLEELLQRLMEIGVRLQGNLRCLAGVEGPYPQSRMQRWLDADWYQFVATDMHRPDCLDGRLGGIPLLREQVGDQQLDSLLRNRIQELVLPTVNHDAD